jgi:hypothetical protein
MGRHPDGPATRPWLKPQPTPWLRHNTSDQTTVLLCPTPVKSATPADVWAALRAPRLGGTARYHAPVKWGTATPIEPTASRPRWKPSTLEGYENLGEYVECMPLEASDDEVEVLSLPIHSSALYNAETNSSLAIVLYFAYFIALFGLAAVVVPLFYAHVLFKMYVRSGTHPHPGFVRFATVWLVLALTFLAAALFTIDKRTQIGGIVVVVFTVFYAMVYLWHPSIQGRLAAAPAAGDEAAGAFFKSLYAEVKDKPVQLGLFVVLLLVLITTLQTTVAKANPGGLVWMSLLSVSLLLLVGFFLIAVKELSKPGG